MRGLSTRERIRTQLLLAPGDNIKGGNLIKQITNGEKKMIVRATYYITQDWDFSVWDDEGYTEEEKIKFEDVREYQVKYGGLFMLMKDGTERVWDASCELENIDFKRPSTVEEIGNSQENYSSLVPGT